MKMNMKIKHITVSAAIALLVLLGYYTVRGDAGTKPQEPVAEFDFHANGKSFAKRAANYHERGEFDISYRLYEQGVANGWVEIRDFYAVLRDDARELAQRYPEHLMTVLCDNGHKNPKMWPVVRIRPGDKVRLWKGKGLVPKKDWLDEDEREQLLNCAAENGSREVYERPTLTLDECRQTLARYDLLRNNVQGLINTTINCLVMVNPDDEALEALRKDLLKLKSEIRVARTRFVSYTLVSPFLAETTRLRRIANDTFLQMLFNHDANAGKRMDAVSMLAHTCHKDILMSCDECVRIQFCDTMSGLKRLSKPEEWAHFQSVTTMIDSYDPGKKLGADAWWG